MSKLLHLTITNNFGLAAMADDFLPSPCFLETISLSQNGITSIAAGLFDGCAATLKLLLLNRNQLAALPDGFLVGPFLHLARMCVCAAVLGGFF